MFTLKKKERDSNIELLRLLMGMAVIVLHFNYSPGGSGAVELCSGTNYYFLLLLESVCCIAVNVFLIISGYYSVNRKEVNIVKGLELILQVVVFNLIFYLLTFVIQRDFSGITLKSMIGASLPLNYYVTLYVVVLFLSPYINMVINHLSEKNLDKLMILISILFLIFPTILDLFANKFGDLSGLYTIGTSGSGAGYTIVNFIVCYFWGAYLRKKDLIRVKTISLLLAWVLTVGLLLTWKIVYPVAVWHYSNPLLMLEAVLVFIIFTKLQIKNNVINILAPASFCCFLIHERILKCIDLSFVSNCSLIVLIGYLVCILVGIYFISWLVYLIWAFLTKKLFMKWEAFGIRHGWTLGAAGERDE